MRVRTAVRFALLLGARVVGRAVALLRHPLSLNVLLLAAIGGALAALDGGSSPPPSRTPSGGSPPPAWWRSGRWC